MNNAIVRKKLPVQLSEFEIAQAAMQSSTLAQEYERIEDEKKATTSRLTEQLKSKRAEMMDRSRMATTGIEERFVECTWVIEREDRRACLRRLDTGSVVESRELTDSEMQLNLDEVLAKLIANKHDDHRTSGARPDWLEE